MKTVRLFRCQTREKFSELLFDFPINQHWKYEFLNFTKDFWRHVNSKLFRFQTLYELESLSRLTIMDRSWYFVHGQRLIKALRLSERVLERLEQLLCNRRREFKRFTTFLEKLGTVPC